VTEKGMRLDMSDESRSASDEGAPVARAWLDLVRTPDGAIEIGEPEARLIVPSGVDALEWARKLRDDAEAHVEKLKEIGHRDRRGITNIEWARAINEFPIALALLRSLEEYLRERSHTCRRCGRTSYHPYDKKYRYCSACHQFDEKSNQPDDNER
jgi:crotonobetainyl-CoA:carnitine CoA-transferase CaiB-like acyl-CoA transferase